jgi:hypothetical protein
MTTHPLHHLGFRALLSRPGCPDPPVVPIYKDGALGEKSVQQGQPPVEGCKTGNEVRVVKGAMVRLADGTVARVQYADPNMRIARVRTEKGKNLTVRHKDLRGMN